MKNCFKRTFFTLLIGLGALNVVSCSNDSESRNEVTKTERVADKVTLKKKWVVAHFYFNENVNSALKFKYQVANVHIDLDNDNFSALDHYSLSSDSGNWNLNGEIITLHSNNDKEKYRFKIVELTNSSLVVEVIDHKELAQIELVSLEKK